MKKHLRRMLAALLCALTVLSVCTIAAGAQITDEALTGAELEAAEIGAEPELAETGEPTVVNVSAQEIEMYGAYYAITWALEEAQEYATAENPYRVVVEPGSYCIPYGLCIYSNTTLVLTGVTLTRSRAINMLRTGYGFDTADSGVTGYYYENITIEGGTLDAENSSINSTMIKVVHTKNFTMKDVTVKNLYDGHMMEVAGCDGLTVTGCTFTDQVVPAGGIRYEALQLDILYSEHMNNCRSEDLAIKNVLIENCTFNNCPRGVGTHTAVLNNPFNNIVIRNNTFTNMKSAAIQSINWTNVEISDNVIDTTPRGIALYSVLDQGQGTYKASVLAAEGGTTAHYSDSFQTPPKANVVVKNNTITNCGTVKDIYAKYECSAISVMGAKVTTSKAYSDSSGSLPTGDYYVDGVKIENNYISVKGHGLRIEDVRNIQANSNVILCSANTVYPANYYGMAIREDVRNASFKNNYIENASVNSFQIDCCTNITEISGNEIYTSGKYGMAIYNTSIGSILNNLVSNTPNNSIGVMRNSSVSGKISGNRITGSSANGIHIASDSTAASVEKNTTVNCTGDIAYTRSTGHAKVGTNYTSSAAVTSVTLNERDIIMGVGKSWRLNKTANPINAVTTFTYSSSNTAVAAVDKTGRITAKAVGTAAITVRTANGKTASVPVTVNTSKGDPIVTGTLATPSVTKIENVNTGVKLTWGAVSGASKYRVYLKSGSSWSKLADVSAASYTHTGVKSGTKYTYTVRCLSADGKSFTSGFSSSGWSITFISAPAISKTENTASGVKLSWSKVTGAAKYRIYLKNGSSWSKLADTTSTTYTHTAAKSGTSYTYTLRCVTSDGKSFTSGYNTTGWNHQFTLPQLATPSVTKFENTATGTKVTWGAVSGAPKYRLFVKSGGSWKKVADTTATSYTYGGLTSGTTYTYTVRVISADAKTFRSGYNTTGWSYRYIAPPAAPTLKNTASGVKVTWKAPAGAVKYRIYRKIGTGSWSKLADTTATSYVDKSVTVGKKYSYTIRCISSDGKSFQSYYNTTGSSITATKKG